MKIMVVIGLLFLKIKSLSGCDEGYLYDQGNCIPCLDDQCGMCKNNSLSSCIRCKIGFEVVNHKCGKECIHIDNCKVCTTNLTQCIRCNKGCQLSNLECSCIERIAIISSCVILSLIVIGIVIFCLTKPTIFVGNKITLKPITSFNPVINQYQIRQRQLETAPMNVDIDLLPSNRKDELMQIDDHFNMNKIDVEEVGEKQLCDQCKEQNGNVMLGCGCLLCYDHSKPIEKLNERIKFCPVCKKEVESMKQITCGICFQNKLVLSKFSCLCTLLICKECFVHTMQTNRSCPACRTMI